MPLKIKLVVDVTKGFKIFEINITIHSYKLSFGLLVYASSVIKVQQVLISNHE